jgi:large subunit ribosomal protein L35
MATKRKTRKAVAARFRVTATGKLKFARAGKRHLNSKKPTKRKRQLKRPGILGNKKMIDTFSRMMGVA